MNREYKTCMTLAVAAVLTVVAVIVFALSTDDTRGGDSDCPPDAGHRPPSTKHCP